MGVQESDKSKQAVKNALAALNKHLEDKSFLVGENITLADIAVTCSLFMIFTQAADAAYRAPYVNVLRWFTTCVNQPEFAKVLGDVVLCVEPKQPGAASAAKAEKPKAAPAPKKEEKPKAAAKDDDEEEEDEDMAREEKPKGPHWSEALAPTTMKLDDFKRLYSNNDTRSVAMPGFWQMFDKTGYSLWFAYYKYNAELEKQFKTANLVSGFFQV